MAKKPRAQVTAEYEARIADQGGGRLPTVMLNAEEMALWERVLAQDQGAPHGKAKRTILRALTTLENRNDLDWPAELRRLADYLEKDMK